jgi:hypothetical protein
LRHRLGFCNYASAAVHLLAAMMTRPAERAGLREGGIYVDLDGTHVRLLRIIDDVCCWVAADKGWNDRQHTLNCHFAKRFHYDSKATARFHAKHVIGPDGHPGPAKVSTGHGTFILHAHETAAPEIRKYRVGERVPQSGIYRALHDAGDISSTVILLAGSIFPYCAQCGIEVHFEFAIDVPRKLQYHGFEVQTLEIPHPIIGSGFDLPKSIAY